MNRRGSQSFPICLDLHLTRAASMMSSISMLQRIIQCVSEACGVLMNIITRLNPLREMSI